MAETARYLFDYPAQGVAVYVSAGGALVGKVGFGWYPVGVPANDDA